MPQVAWEALLREAVQGLCRPYSPKILRRWLQTTLPQGLAISAPQASPPDPPPPHWEGKEQGQGKGKGRERTARQGGEEGPKVTGRRPQGQGTGGGATRGQETTNGPGRGRTRGCGTEGEGATTGTRAHTQEGHATTEGPTPPHPQLTPRDPRRRTPAKTRRLSTDLTTHGPQQLTPTDHLTPHRGGRAHPHGEKGLHASREPPRIQPHSPPPRHHPQATTPATARATTQAPEEEKDTAATPRTRGKDTQRTRHQGTGPQGGQRGGHPPYPQTRVANPDPRSTDPTSHPTPNRAPQPPGSHIT